MKRLLFLVLVLAGCTATKTTTTSATTETTTAVEMVKPADRILFLTMKIVKDTVTGTTTITLLDKKISDGTFKDRASNDPLPPPYLTVEVYEQQELVSTASIEHPLYKDVEFTTDNHKLIHRAISLTESEFFV